MAAPKWQPGTVYIPGDIVQPVSGAPASGEPIVNPNLTGSATGWNLPAQFSYDGASSFTAGSGSIRFDTVGDGFFTFRATDGIPVTPGQSITASCMFQQGATDAGLLAGQVALFWSNGADSEFAASLGSVVNSGSGGAWSQSTVTAVAPAGAAFVRIGGAANRIGQNLPAWFDNFTWNYTGSGTPEGLIYKAVQPGSGISGATEPVWPSVLGVQVVDNTVTWEAIAATRVTWEASPVLVSGATEPTWPTQIGESVADGSIKWTAFSRRVEDENCPNSKVVAIVQSKVFAADGDIVRFCATANPLDWTTERDAGYLPTGLQQANANDMAVLNQYRSNLVAFNASSFQNWQADPDPEVMAILDQMDGVGSIWQQAAKPVGNELFYLSQLGVRTVGIAGGSTNLQAGDVGMPVDPLVKDAIRVAVANSSKAVATYYPSSGQYWLTFANYPPSPLTLEGDLGDGQIGDAVDFEYVAGGGVQPYTWSIASGALPSGLTLSQTGRVTGERMNAGQYAWTVRITDADGAFVDLPDGSLTFGWFSEVSAWTGDGAASVTPPVNTKLDLGGLAWTKSQSATGDHVIDYSLDGATVKRIRPSNIAAAPTTTGTTFDQFGATFNDQNTLGVQYSCGAIARAPGILAIVEYTGNGANRNIAHDLGVAPGMMIVKALDSGTNYCIYHQAFGSTQAKQGWTGAIAAAATIWNNTAPTSAQFSLGTSSVVNNAGTQYVAFLFADGPNLMVDSVANVANSTVAGFASTPGWMLGASSGASAIADSIYNDRFLANWQFTRPNSSDPASANTGSRSRAFGGNHSAGFEFGEVAAGAAWSGLTGFVAIPERKAALNDDSWNPGDAVLGALTLMALSNSDRTVTVASGVNQGIRSRQYHSSGKRYFEVQPLGSSITNFNVGVATIFDSLSSGNIARWAYFYDGRKSSSAGTVAYSSAYASGDVIGVAVDLDAKKVWFSKNGVFVGDPVAGTGEAFATLNTMSMYAFCAMAGSASTGTLRAKASQQTYSAPAGFLPWVQE